MDQHRRTVGGVNSYIALRLAEDRRKTLIAEADHYRLWRSLKRTRRSRRARPSADRILKPVALPPTVSIPSLGTPEFRTWVTDIGAFGADHGLAALGDHVRHLATAASHEHVNEHLVQILVDRTAPDIVRLRALAKVTTQLLNARRPASQHEFVRAA